MPSSDATGTPVQVRLVAPALPASLEEVHALLEELVQRSPGITARERMRFETALVEVASNVIQHAQPRPPDEHVTVTVVLRCDDAALTADLVDDALPAQVDPAAAEMPAPDAESGRGLALARSLCDELRLVREGDGNRWTVVCRRG